MAAPTLADFRARFPEFSATSDAAASLAIDDAKRHHALTAVGWLLCAAHLLALRSDTASVGGYDGGAGEVITETMGPRTVEYVPMAGEDPNRVFYTSTRYGREFLAVEARTPRRRISAVAVG